LLCYSVPNDIISYLNQKRKPFFILFLL